jgi:shikimate dehydrogenase
MNSKKTMESVTGMSQSHPFPNKDTVVCISIASRPSNFGCTLHNAGYRALNLNFLYKSFGITDQKALIHAVRVMGIRGCSVSMPFKQSIIKELDKLDATAKEIGAVNTIVNDSGVLIGYNTDTFGAEMVLRNIGFVSDERVLIIGAGGVALAIIYALNRLNAVNITICNRNAERIDELDSERRFSRIDWEERNRFKADLLINATPIGMAPETNGMPISEESINNFKSFFDVVVSPPKTRLIACAVSLNKNVIHGYQMSFYQAVKQFELYTGHEAPHDVLQKAIIGLLGLDSSFESFA